MSVRTLVVGYVPPELNTVKGAKLLHHQYFLDTLAKYDLGELLFMSEAEASEKINEVNPLLVFAVNEYYAKEIKSIKSDCLLYVIPSYSHIFSRKNETEERKATLNKILIEAEGVIADVLLGKTDDVELRKYAALSYKDLYEMITRALISEDEDLKKKAWDLLWGEGEKHHDIIWMRVQMMAEVWEHSKGERLEQLMLMSMDRHIELGTARKMDMFTDIDGRQHHQYMFIDPYANDLNYIRRLPRATKDQERFGYERELDELGIPTNFLRIQVEANECRKQYDEHLQAECDKIQAVIDKYKENPKLSKRELGVGVRDEMQSKKPLTKKEFKILGQMLKENRSLISTGSM